MTFWQYYDERNEFWLHIIYLHFKIKHRLHSNMLFWICMTRNLLFYSSVYCYWLQRRCGSGLLVKCHPPPIQSCYPPAGLTSGWSLTVFSDDIVLGGIVLFLSLIVTETELFSPLQYKCTLTIILLSFYFYALIVFAIYLFFLSLKLSSVYFYNNTYNFILHFDIGLLTMKYVCLIYTFFYFYNYIKLLIIVLY